MEAKRFGIQKKATPWLLFVVYVPDLVLRAGRGHSVLRICAPSQLEEAFGANGGISVPIEQVVAGHHQIMVHFLISFAILILIPFVWSYFVSREKKKYPERYRKY